MIMKAIGVSLNIICIIALIIFLISYFSSINESPEFVSVIGSEDGPTSIFFTAKINHTFLIAPFCFIIVFVFNIWFILKKK
jgi:Na+-transporting methylmalonyl-CoA/oxaloacetate decarboxylase beta subunit